MTLTAALMTHRSNVSAWNVNTYFTTHFTAHLIHIHGALKKHRSDYLGALIRTHVRRCVCLCVCVCVHV